MKVFFTADLHGKETLYEQCDAFVESEKPDILILGGDLFPEAQDVHDTPKVQRDFIDRAFRPRLARFRAQGVEEILIILGNHDLASCETSVCDLEQRGLCHYLHNREVRVSTPKGDIAFVGYSFSPPSPYVLRDFDKKDLARERPDEACMLPDNRGYISKSQQMIEVANREFFESRGSMEEDLAKLAKSVGPGHIFVCHAPPWSQYLDCETPALHVGSKAVRDFIGRTRPRLGLHGHIHLSPKNSGRFQETVEGTSCVQPGQKFNNLHGVFFETADPAQTLRHTVLQTARQE